MRDVTRDGIRNNIVAYIAAVVAASAGTALIVAIDHAVHIPNVSLLYLPLILVIAVYFGTWPSLLAATLAVLEYDFFLLQPLFTFTINQAQDVVAFVIFVVVAILTSQLAAQARDRADAAQRRAQESTTLYELGQALMSATAIPAMLHAITRRVVTVFGVDRCAIYVPDADGRPNLAAETPDGPAQDRAGRATALWVLRKGTQVWLSGQNEETLDRGRTYVPLRTSDRVVGVMEVGPKHGRALDPEERRLLTVFAAQAALVIAQAQNEEARQRLELVEESDRLKTSLLNAVSHDLRTPLASIKASATSLLLSDASWTSEQAREFLEAIDHEADRLNRLVGNLLDLSRIEAGVLRPALEWYDIHEIVAGIVAGSRLVAGDRSLEVDVDPSVSAVQLDRLRIEELAINLVDNAARYSPQDSPIEIRVWRHSGHGTQTESLCLAVIDHGPGVPPELRPRIFATFYQGQQQGDRRLGTGLGLAICRGIAQAHGGTIRVETTPGGGATFVLELPPSSIEQGVPA